MRLPSPLTVGLLAAALPLTACAPGAPSGGEASDGSSRTTASAESTATPSTWRTTEDRTYTGALYALGRTYERPPEAGRLPASVTDERLQQLIDDGKLPEAPSHSEFFDATAWAATHSEEPVDVLFLGDSMTEQGVDPQTVAAHLEKRLGREVNVHVGATGRARWGINDLLVDTLVRADAVPEVVVPVISTQSAGRDKYYETDAQKQPLSAVVQGCDRPISRTWTASDERRCQEFVDSPRARWADEAGTVKRALRGEEPARSLSAPGKGHLRSDGHHLYPGISAAEARKQTEKRDGPLSGGPPSSHPSATRDFTRMVDTLEEHGATVLSTEVPYPPPRQQIFEEKYRGYDARRRENAQHLADAAGIEHHPVRRMGSWWGDGDSRDVIHLSAQGAVGFSHQLMNDTPGLEDAIVEALDR